MSSNAPAIPGADAVVGFFGYWPSFHDAEILELHLDRSGPSRMSILTWKRLGPGDIGQTGTPAVVTFAFGEVRDLSLEDFSCQNVVSGLDVAASSDGESLRLTLGPCYGLSGWIEAAGVTVNVSPGDAGTGTRDMPGG